MNITQSRSWAALAQHRDQILRRPVRDLFAADPARFDRLSLRLDDLLLDFSKQHLTAETVKLLVDLANERGLADGSARMAAGPRCMWPCAPSASTGWPAAA
jgi:glucose-6-phosphate isomerase